MLIERKIYILKLGIMQCIGLFDAQNRAGKKLCRFNQLSSDAGSSTECSNIATFLSSDGKWNREKCGEHFGIDSQVSWWNGVCLCVCRMSERSNKSRQNCFVSGNCCGVWQMCTEAMDICHFKIFITATFMLLLYFFIRRALFLFIFLAFLSVFVFILSFYFAILFARLFFWL